MLMRTHSSTTCSLISAWLFSQRTRASQKPDPYLPTYLTMLFLFFLFSFSLIQS